MTSFGITSDTVENHFYGFNAAWLFLFSAATIYDTTSTNLLGLAYYASLGALYNTFEDHSTAFMRMFNAGIFVLLPAWLLLVTSISYIAIAYFSYTEEAGPVSTLDKIIVWAIMLGGQIQYSRWTWTMKGELQTKKEALHLALIKDTML